MQRCLAFILALALCFGLCACAGSAPQETTPTETQQQKVEDDGIMKILLIGNSHGTDSSYMFPDICKNEGVENLVFGRLYHSGCRLVQHLDYAKANAAQYSYDEYDISKDNCWQRAYADGSWKGLSPVTATDKYIEDGSIAQTMQFGIQRHDWDIIILQASTYEGAGVAADTYYVKHGHKLDLVGHARELMDYVLSQDIEPSSVPQFGWNITWSRPADRNAWTEDKKRDMDAFFGGDQNLQYTLLMQTHQEVIAPAFDFDYVLPVGTVIQNLKTTKLRSDEIYRDYGHATDFGRMAVAYLWYCLLFNKDITECQLSPINYKVVRDEVVRLTQKDMELTQEQRDILVEAVGNTLKAPFEVTQSQYVE